MKEENYYNEIESFIKKNEINKKRRILEENYDILNNYWKFDFISSISSLLERFLSIHKLM